MSTSDVDDKAALVAFTSEIVAAHVGHNKVRAEELPTLISNVHATLVGLTAPKTDAAPQFTPAVPVRRSVKPDHLVCLEDGKKVTMLKRYLRTNYNMTPEQYRARWGLPADYPMVAPNYAEKRRHLALKIGLGRKAKAAV